MSAIRTRGDTQPRVAHLAILAAMAQVEHTLELDAPAARELLERDESAVLVDVRASDEWAGGYIPGAVLVPAVAT